jgi:hypothetical protein
MYSIAFEYSVLKCAKSNARLSFLSFSALIHEAFLRIMTNSFLTWAGYQPVAKRPTLEDRGVLFRVCCP